MDAEILLSFILNKNRPRTLSKVRGKEYLYTYPEKNLTTAQLTKFKKLINKRATNYPLAYLTNHKEFFDLDFYVNKRVLIPRPETEILIEQALSLIKPNYNIVDIGTGSGCIIISLAKNLPKNFRGKLFASDVSHPALAIARKNTKKHRVNKRISFYQGDLLKPLKNLRFDLIIANLPYLSQLNKDIVHEPKSALLAGADGLKYYGQLLKQVNKYLSPGGSILLEIDPKQKTKITKLAKKYLPLTSATIKKDLRGLARLVIIKQ